MNDPSETPVAPPNDIDVETDNTRRSAERYRCRDRQHPSLRRMISMSRPTTPVAPPRDIDVETDRRYMAMVSSILRRSNPGTKALLEFVAEALKK
jgi:hypothetical protein